MQPNVIIGTGENLGKIDLNIDQWKIMRETGGFLWDIFFAEGKWKFTIPFFSALLFLIWIKSRIRHKDWENRERQKARIRKEESEK